MPGQGPGGSASAGGICVATVQRHGDAGPIIAALSQHGIDAEALATQRPGLGGLAVQAAFFPQHLVSDGPWEVRVAANHAERARRILAPTGAED
jgi:hypothetical protein